jgi:hypothetical protein
MGLVIKKAVRELVYVKLALMGASGSGKSYSSLRLAKGMAQELQVVLGRTVKTLMINTEKSRGLYYANEFEYDIAAIDAPHEPEKYAGAVDEAVKLGYDILIMDSTSPEWEGQGGCLAIQQSLGGRYQDWGKVTPRHDKFLLAIAESPIHIIGTMRGKDQYEMEKDDNQHVTVTKIGVGAKQREGFEYEFTSTFLLNQKDNFAETQKDNTHLFEKRGRLLLTEEDGISIVKWANSGEGYTPKVYKDVVTPESALSAIKKDIIEKIKSKGGAKNEELSKLFTDEKIALTPKGVNAISDMDFATSLLKKLDTVKEIQ